MQSTKSKSEESDALPPYLGPTTSPQKRRFSLFYKVLLTLGIAVLISLYTGIGFPTHSSMHLSYNYGVVDAGEICSGYDGKGTSYSGFMQVKSDTDVPKKLFFWYFEAENNPESAPIILTIGGGPGTSGMMNPIFGQSPCIITEDGLQPNPNRWTEHFNLLALDHPIGAGFSHGSPVNNSRRAALDTYDFLQGFFDIFPSLANNQFVISGGSYGGVYVPNIATVIQEQNALVDGKGSIAPRFRNAQRINLESLIISNPLSNIHSHFSWLTYYRCSVEGIYNSTTCAEQYSALPKCLQSIEFGKQEMSPAHIEALSEDCFSLRAWAPGYEDVVLEDVRRKCQPPPDNEDPLYCHPEFKWINSFFGNESIKEGLGVPTDMIFNPVSFDVFLRFLEYGDIFLPHYLLYEDLFKQGIRILHYIGSKDANCAWPGVLSFLELLETQHQKAFLEAPDVPYPSAEDKQATVRVVGEEAGNMTYILLDGAGHFVVKDQPKLAKKIVEHWVMNQEWFSQ